MTEQTYPAILERDAQPTAPATMLLSAADLAREFRLSIKTITRMDQSGKLPRGLKIGTGRAKRWSRETIVAWVAAGAPCRREWERIKR